MTRENKAGLVVASSFLILVSVVAALKLREPADSPGPEPGSEVAAVPTKSAPPPMNVPPAENKPQPVPPSTPAPGTGSAAPPPVGNTPPAAPPSTGVVAPIPPPAAEPVPPPPGGAAPPPVSDPPPPLPGAAGPLETTLDSGPAAGRFDHVPLPLKEKAEAALTAPPTPPLAAGADPAPRGQRLPELKDDGKPEAQEVQPPKPPEGRTTPPPAAVPPPPGADAPPPPIGTITPVSGVETTSAPLPPAGAGGKDEVDVTVPPDPPPPVGAKAETKGGDKEKAPAVVAPRAAERPPVPPARAEGKTSGGRPLERSEFIPRAPAPGQPRLEAPRPAPAKPAEGAAIRRTGAEGTAAAPPPGEPRPFPAEDAGSRLTPVAAGEAKPPPRPEMVTTLPPLGTAPRPRTEPIVAGGRPGMAAAPRGDGYRVEQYRATDKDTWEALAARYYGNDRAARALQAFNRGYFQASARLQREGTLTAGETYFIPAMDVLVKKHGLQLDAAPAPRGP